MIRCGRRIRPLRAVQNPCFELAPLRLATMSTEATMAGTNEMNCTPRSLTRRHFRVFLSSARYGTRLRTKVFLLLPSHGRKCGPPQFAHLTDLLRHDSVSKARNHGIPYFVDEMDRRPPHGREFNPAQGYPVQPAQGFSASQPLPAYTNQPHDQHQTLPPGGMAQPQWQKSQSHGSTHVSSSNPSHNRNNGSNSSFAPVELLPAVTLHTPANAPVQQPSQPRQAQFPPPSRVHEVPPAASFPPSGSTLSMAMGAPASQSQPQSLQQGRDRFPQTSSRIQAPSQSWQQHHPMPRQQPRSPRTSTLSTPSGSTPAYGDAYISPQSVRSGPESPDPLNLLSPVGLRTSATQRPSSPTPRSNGNGWFSSQSRSLSGLDQAMGDSTLTSAPQKRRKIDGTESTPKHPVKKQKGPQGPSPVKPTNFYALPPDMPRPPPPSVEIPPMSSSSMAATPVKRGRGRPKGSKSKPKLGSSSSKTGLSSDPPVPERKPQIIKPAPAPRKKPKAGTTFTSSLPLALPDSYDSGSAEEWDKDGDFEVDDGGDSDFEIVGTAFRPPQEAQWQTPESKGAARAAAPVPSTSVIKTTERRSALARFAEFIEEALEAESNLPDASEYADGLPGPAAAFFVIVDDTAILKPAKLQMLGKLIRSCASLKPAIRRLQDGGDDASSELRSIHDLAIGDLQKILRMLSAVTRVGEAVNPFQHASSSARSTKAKPAPAKQKQKRASKNKDDKRRSESAEFSGDEDESDEDEDQRERSQSVESISNGRAEAAPPEGPRPSTSPAKPSGDAAPADLSTSATESDQQVLVERLSRISTSLMAVDCCLSLLSVPHLDKSLVSEDIIRPCFDILRASLELVVYPFVEACSNIGVVASHPLLSAWIEAIAPVGSKGKRGRRKKNANGNVHNAEVSGIFAACGEYLSRIFKDSCSCMTQAQKLVHLPSMSLAESIIFSAIYAGMGPFFAIEPEVLTGASDAAKSSMRGRAAMEALAPGAGAGGAAMKALRLPALNLLCDLFARNEDQRQWMVEELLTSLTKLPDMKKNRRQHSLRDGGAINSITALLLQLIQTTAHGIRSRVTPKAAGAAASSSDAALEMATAAKAEARHGKEDDDDDDESARPTSYDAQTDYDLPSLRRAIDGPAQAAKAISTFLMAKISPTKVTKSSGDFTYASVVENLVTDLLACVFLPDWPAASLLLTSLCRAFSGTLQDPKSTPDARGVALEHTGHIAAYIRQSRLRMKTRQPTEESQAQGATRLVKSLDELEADYNVDALNDLNTTYIAMLSFLSAAEKEDKMAQSATDFLVSQWGSELAKSLIRTSAALSMARESEESPVRAEVPALETFLSGLHQSLLLVSKHGKTMANGGAAASHSVFDVRTSGTFDDIKDLSEQLVHTTFFAVSFDSLCNMLVDFLGSQSVGNRTKALRGLGEIYAVDSGLLAVAPVREVIERRLEDESAGVREAAVNLLSKYLLTQPDDAQALYERLRERSFDKSLGVRKRVVKLLASLYRTLPSKSMRIDACLRIVRCVSEDVGIQELVIGILGDLWLRIGCDDLEEPTKQGGGTAGIEGAASSNGEKEIDLAKDLGDDVSIIVSVASQIRDRPSPLEEIFRRFGRDKSEEGTNRLSERLRALSDVLISELVDAAAPAESGTASSASDALARIKTLYLVISTNPAVLSISNAKNLLPFVKSQFQAPEDAPMLETLLKIFRVSLPLMPKTALAFAKQLEALLRPILNNPPPLITVMQEVTACFATLIRCHTHNYELLIRMMGALLRALRGVSARVLQNPNAPVDNKSQVIMWEASLLCENGDFDGMVKDQPEREATVQTACGNRPVKDQIFELMIDIRHNSRSYSSAALRCIGALFRGFPSLMDTDQGKSVMTGVFASGNTTDKEMLLKVFVEILTHDESAHAMELSKTQAIEARDRATATKKTNPAGGGSADKVNMKELVGDTDSFAHSSVSLNLVAQYIEPVIAGSLAIDKPAMQRVAMDVLKYIVLQGLSHPLQCVPSLISLETVENRLVSSRALSMHEHLWSKHGTLLAPHATRHIRASFDFQLKLHEGDYQNLRGYRIDAASGTATALLHAWYGLLRDRRQTRLEFVKGMTKLMDIDTSSLECPEQTVLLSRYLADNLATLEYKTIEEVFVVVGELKRILSVTGVQVKFFGEAFIRGLSDAVPLRHPGAILPPAEPVSLQDHGGPYAWEGNATFDGITFGDVGDSVMMGDAVGEEELPAMQIEPSAADRSQQTIADGHHNEKRTAADTARMSIAMGTALLLRNHLKTLYGVSEERCNKYVPGKKQSAGADRPATKKVIDGEPLSFDAMPLALDSVSSTPNAVEQLVTFENLMNAEGTLVEDADDWHE